METPSSTIRVTRSQNSALSQKSKQEDGLSRSRTGSNLDRSALLDITNDSPVIGLAAFGLAEKTPLSSTAKSRVRSNPNPGSGEALLRGQVKILLQKVEETELVNKLPPNGYCPSLCAVLGFRRSPAQLLAPTPANTPHIESLTACKEEEEDSPMNPQEVVIILKKEEHGPCMLNRALLFDDSPGKSEISDTSSTLSYVETGGSRYRIRSSEDDSSSSAWSLQVNTSIKEEEDDEGELEDEVVDDNYYDDGYNEEGGHDDEDEGGYDELCNFLNKLSVEEKARLPEFEGRKHTRFIYNSDDDIDGEVEIVEVKKVVSPGATALKGLPVPEGKHIRFIYNSDDDIDGEVEIVEVKKVVSPGQQR